MVPESEIVKLEMSVADGIKYIISLGALQPENPEQAASPLDLERHHAVLK
jgi:uncharacterized membrane protein